MRIIAGRRGTLIALALHMSLYLLPNAIPDQARRTLECERPDRATFSRLHAHAYRRRTVASSQRIGQRRTRRGVCVEFGQAPRARVAT